MHGKAKFNILVLEILTRRKAKRNDSGVLRAVSFSYPYCSSVCMYCAGSEEGGGQGAGEFSAIRSLLGVQARLSMQRPSVMSGRVTHLPAQHGFLPRRLLLAAVASLLPLSFPSAAVPGHLLFPFSGIARFLRVTSSTMQDEMP